MFRSAFLQRGDPTRGLLLSALLHVIAITAIISEPLYHFGSVARWMSPTESLPPKHAVIYYTKADLLPLISPPKPKASVRRAPRPAPSRTPVKLAFHPVQTIVSRPQAPDNRRQTIMQPQAPLLEVRADIRVPNMIRWEAPNVPAPPVRTQFRRRVVEPPPELPTPPVARVLPALPKLSAIAADASAIPLAPVSTVHVPRLAVPVRIARAAAVPAAPVAPVARAVAVRTAPDLPSAPTMEMNGTTSLLPDMVAISVVPAPPSDEVMVPPGSRAGEFAASPEGTGDQSSGNPSSTITIASTGSEPSEVGGEVDGDDTAQIRVPGLSVSGGRPAAVSDPLRGSERSPGRSPDPGSDLKRMMASVSRPALLPEAAKERPVESAFFGTRRVYTVYMNMPNLTSGAGSWVLRFAELNARGMPQGGDGELSTPEAIRKVDPMYVASAVREKVQGTVTLAAIVLKDGSLANIRVVGSLDERLDTSAVAALTQWRFQPARKNRAPIDLEVLVQIPFRL